MSLKPGELRKYKTAIRDLGDKELAIRSRRKQLFDLLAASCGDEKKALRTARVIYYELHKEVMRKARAAGMEFMDTELEGEEEGEGNGPDGFEPEEGS